MVGQWSAFHPGLYTARSTKHSSTQDSRTASGEASVRFAQTEPSVPSALNQTMQLASFEAFLTVISGILVFIVGQFLLKVTLEPALQLKRKIAKVRKQLHRLVHQRFSFHEDYGYTKNDIKIISNFSEEMLSLAHSIPLIYHKNNCLRRLFSFLRCLSGLPPLRNLEQASSKLLELSYILIHIQSIQKRTQELKKDQYGISGQERVMQRETNAEDDENLNKRIKKLIEEIRNLLGVY